MASKHNAQSSPRPDHLLQKLHHRFRVIKSRPSTKTRPKKSKHGMLNALEWAAGVYGLKLTTAIHLWSTISGGNWVEETAACEENAYNTLESHKSSVHNSRDVAADIIDAGAVEATISTEAAHPPDDSQKENQYDAVDSDWFDSLDMLDTREDLGSLEVFRQDIAELEATHPEWIPKARRTGTINGEECKDRGCATSRGQNDRYDGGDRDRLASGSGPRVPEGLVRRAGGSGGADGGGEDGDRGRAGGGDDNGDGGDEDDNAGGGIRNPACENTANDSLDTPPTLGGFADIEAVQSHILEWRKTHLGPRHHGTLSAMVDMVEVLRILGRDLEAMFMEGDIAELKKEIFPPTPPETDRPLDGLFSLATNTSKIRSWESMDLELLALRRKFLGASHYDTLTLATELADAWYQQGRYIESESLLLQYLQLGKEVSGPQNHATRIAMIRLIAQYDEQDHPYLLDIEAKKLKLQYEDPWTVLDTIGSMQTLLERWREHGQYEKAESMEITILKLKLRAIDPRDPEQVTAMEALADTCYKYRRYDKAEALKRQVLELKRSLLGRKHLETLNTMEELADRCYHQRQYEDAEWMEHQVLDLKQEDRDIERILALQQSAQDVYEDQERCGDIDNSFGMDDRADIIHFDVIQAIEKEFGASHLSTMIAVADLSHLWEQFKRPRVTAEARENDAPTIDPWEIHAQIRDRAAAATKNLILGLQKQIPDRKHHRIAAMSSLAEIALTKGHYAKSESLNLATLGLQTSDLGDRHPDTIGTQERLAKTWYELGKFEQAAAVQVSVINMSGQVFGSEDDRTVSASRRLATWWEEWDNAGMPDRNDRDGESRDTEYIDLTAGEDMLELVDFGD